MEGLQRRYCNIEISKDGNSVTFINSGGIFSTRAKEEAKNIEAAAAKEIIKDILNRYKKYQK
jgi:hypothetical protein